MRKKERYRVGRTRKKILQRILRSLFCFSFTAASFKSGKINNITAMSSGLFACEKITFEEPFSGGKQVKVFVSPGNSTNGAAVWVESEDQRQFRPCISEYIDGSNAAAEIKLDCLGICPLRSTTRNHFLGLLDDRNKV